MPASLKVFSALKITRLCWEFKTQKVSQRLRLYAKTPAHRAGVFGSFSKTS